MKCPAYPISRAGWSLWHWLNNRSDSPKYQSFDMMTSSNETFSTLLALCERNSPVTGEFPSQRPVIRNFDIFFDLLLNKRLSKPSGRRWFETPSRSLWRHCNEKSGSLSVQARYIQSYEYLHIHFWCYGSLIKSTTKLLWSLNVLVGRILSLIALSRNSVYLRALYSYSL